MHLRRGLLSFLVIAVAAGAMGQEATEQEAVKPGRRGFFSGLFKKDAKKVEEEDPAKKKEESPKKAPAVEEAAPKEEAAKKEMPAPQPETPPPVPAPKQEPAPPPTVPAEEKKKESPVPAPTSTAPKPKPEVPQAATAKVEPAVPPPTPDPKPAMVAAPETAVPAEKTPPQAESPPMSKREAALEQIRTAIRTAARQLEKERKRRGQEPGEVVKKVEELLTTQAQAQLRLTMRTAQTLKALRRPEAPFQFAAATHTGGRGYSLDQSEDGRQAVIDELYLRKEEGLREVDRLLEVSRLWLGQKRTDQASALAQRAVLAAREQVKLRPKDAAAHASLAEALSLGEDGARVEMLREVETALSLQPNEPKALLVRLTDQADRLREHLLREGPRRLELPARDPREVMRRLHAQPPSDEALAAHEAAAWELRRLVARVMDNASGKPDLMLRASAALLAPALDVEIAELARSRKARSFEQFEMSVALLEITGARSRMEKADWQTATQRALDAAGKNGQMIAVISAMPVLWTAASTPGDVAPEELWSTIPEKYRQMFERGMDRAAEIGLKDDSAGAAKACEAVACLEFAAAGWGAKVRHEGFALRAIALDPWRIHALDLLAATCATGFPAAAQALMEIRAAALPGYNSLQRCAAAALHAEDWAAAERHLQACLKLRPDSLETLNHLIAVRLWGAQTPERFAEIEERFERARALYNEREETLPAAVAEDFVVNYIVFLCLKEDWKSATDVFGIAALGGRLREGSAKELAVLIKSR